MRYTLPPPKTTKAVEKPSTVTIYSILLYSKVKYGNYFIGHPEDTTDIATNIQLIDYTNIFILISIHIQRILLTNKGI